MTRTPESDKGKGKGKKHKKTNTAKKANAAEPPPRGVTPLQIATQLVDPYSGNFVGRSHQQVTK